MSFENSADRSSLPCVDINVDGNALTSQSNRENVTEILTNFEEKNNICEKIKIEARIANEHEENGTDPSIIINDKLDFNYIGSGDEPGKDTKDLKFESFNVDNLNRKPSSDFTFVDVGNIKQENEVIFETSLVSTCINDNVEVVYNSGGNHGLSVNSKPSEQKNDQKTYQCDVCLRYCKHLTHLKGHKRIHTGEKPYQCDVCHKSFSLSGSLKTHLRQHTGEKPYQCDVCNKCFKQSSSLKTHGLTHTGEKAYKCDVCSKYFNRSCHLNRHKLTHAGTKSHQCEICNKFFSQSTHLNIHKRTHTGEKPYQCDICNKCFSQSFNLNSHKLTHIGKKIYQCEICDKCFSQSRSLKKHKRKHFDETSAL